MAKKPRTGVGVDAEGGPVVDPTQNVLDLVAAAIQRQDDLRRAESMHVREIMDLRAVHYRELRRAEADRLDAIRNVDVSAVQGATQVAAVAAETLRTQVATTASAAADALTRALEPMVKDIADLRRAQYEAQGVRSNVGETRLNIGALLGGVSVLLVIVFGVAGVVISLAR